MLTFKKFHKMCFLQIHAVHILQIQFTQFEFYCMQIKQSASERICYPENEMEMSQSSANKKSQF